MSSGPPTRVSLVDSVAAAVRDESHRGAASTLVVAGIAGIGKTWFLNALAEQFGRSGFRVRHATGDELDAREPYRLAARLLVDDVAVGPGFAERTFAALDARCDAGPLALFVDDAHLGDGGSLSLFHQIALAAHGPPIVLVLSSRYLPERATLTMLQAAPRTQVIDLTPLTDAELCGLVRRRAGAPPGPRLKAMLADCGGNPHHTIELLSALGARGALEPGNTALDVAGPSVSAPVPEPVSASIRAHLRRLDTPTRELVQLIAALDTPATVEALAAIRMQSPEQLAGLVEAACGSGAVRRSGGELLVPASGFYRRVIYDDIPKGSRLLIHAAIARTLADDVGADARIAHHERLASGPGSSRDPSSLGTTGAFDPDDLARYARTRPDLARAATLAESGRLREAAETADMVLRFEQDAAARTTALMIRLSAEIFAADADRVRLTAAQLSALPLPADTAEWISDVAEWVTLIAGGPLDSRRADARVRPADVDGFTLWQIIPGVRATIAGDCVGALQLFEEGLDVSGGAEGWLTRDAPNAHAWSAWCALYAYGPIAARAYLGQSHPPNPRSISDLWLLPFHHAVRALIEYTGGRLAAAASAADDSLASAARTDSRWCSTAVATRALVDFHLGDLDAAEARLSDWRGTGGPDQFGFPDVDYVAAELHSARGDHDKAAYFSGLAWDAAVERGRMTWAARRAPAIARIAQETGGDLLERVRIDLGTFPAQRCPALAPALVLTEAIDKADSRRAVEAADGFAAVGDSMGELAALETAARSAASADAIQDARAFARRAQNLAGRVGSVIVRQRVANSLRRHGIRLGATGSRSHEVDGWDSLTPAERRVTDLVGQGLTGPQIARILGISPRTVQTHVSHALGKLGLTTRLGLAAVARRRAEY